MYIERVPNRNSPPAVLPDDVIDHLKIALKGGKSIENIESAIEA